MKCVIDLERNRIDHSQTISRVSDEEAARLIRTQPKRYAYIRKQDFKTQERKPKAKSVS